MALKNFFHVIAFSALCLFSFSLLADDSVGQQHAYTSSLCEHLTRPYKKGQKQGQKQGQWDMYITGYGWHSPGAYSKERRRELNEWSYGAGAGRRWVDQNGHEDLLYAFVFLDSHKKIEPVAGYARQWFTPPIGGALSFGAGFTVAMTARADIMHYLPFPFVLPVVSVKVHRASLMAAIVPHLGSMNKGATVLAWGRYSF